MEDNSFKEKFMAMPIEKFTTSPISNMQNYKQVSKVSIPSETETANAKEWVDTNEK